MPTSVFDSSASAYDETFTYSKIGLLQRERVTHFILPYLSPNKKLLELNCGTGHDALTLAPLVESVLATDISEEMITRAKTKKNMPGNVRFNCADLNHIHESLRIPYDLVFSNFGGLNCLDAQQLNAFARNISPHLSENGQLLLVLMGKKCWMENAWFFLTKSKKRGRRNTSEAVLTEVNGSCFNTYYYSTQELKQLFGQEFILKQTRPIGLFIPPSYLNSLFKKRTWLLQLLSIFEKILGRFSVFSNYADHTLLVFQKK